MPGHYIMQALLSSFLRVRVGSVHIIIHEQQGEQQRTMYATDFAGSEASLRYTPILIHILLI